MTSSKHGKDSSNGPVDPFRPELLDEVQGPTYSHEPLMDQLEASMEEVEDFSGLSFDVFDDVSIERLPEGVPAATRNENYRVPLLGGVYDNTVLVADPELLEMPKEERNHALTHENVHGHYFNGKEDKPLKEAGVRGEDAEKLYKFLNSGDEASFEGATEYITHLLDPESSKVGRKFYPKEMKAVENELDTDSELVEDIKGLKDELIDHYTEKYDVDVSEGLYRETGSFAGVEYDAVVMGEDAEAYGEEVVKSYLEEMADYMKEGTYGLDESGQMFDDNAVNWEGWDEKLDYTEGM